MFVTPCAARWMSAQATSALPVSHAAVIAIGDEILTGAVVDANTPWIAKLLYSRGVDLVRAEYVRDDVHEIGESLLRLKERVGPKGIIFTSGGIGPTHDDVSYTAVAKAFGMRLAVHKPTVELMQKHYSERGIELNEARLRMATLPERAEVLVTPGLWVPLAQVQGVYMLPGIPRLFRAMVEAHKERFTGTAQLSRALFSQQGEGDLAAALTRVAEEYPDVSIGSYPNTQESGPLQYQVKIQLMSRKQEALESAAAAIAAALPVTEQP